MRRVIIHPFIDDKDSSWIYEFQTTSPPTVLKLPHMHQPFTAAELAPYTQWDALLQNIRHAFQLPAQCQQFRRNPDAYLQNLETMIINYGLLS